jgi:hypothetical protein
LDLSNLDIISRREAKEKELTFYFTGKPCKHGHLTDRRVADGQCQECNRERARVYSQEKYKNNPESQKNYQKKRYQSDPEFHKTYAKEYRKNNKKKVRDANRIYCENNREKMNEYFREHIRLRKTVDVNFKLSLSLRDRLNKAIKGDWKAGSAVNDLGCSIDELKRRLESQFTSEMSWINYGKYWTIDHIKPLASFDLTDREQFLEACHYTNLQPLYWLDNIIKGDKLISEY